MFALFFFFNDTATTEIYTLSLHDALPISTSLASALPSAASNSTCVPDWSRLRRARSGSPIGSLCPTSPARRSSSTPRRSEEHTSELQSRPHLVCRLLLEKKKNMKSKCLNI